MKCLDLFSGTRSIAKAFEEAGWEVFTIDLDRRFDGISWYIDILKITPEDITRRFGHPDVIWASPPCEKFSVASISHYWTKGSYIPKTEEARAALALLEHTLELIKQLSPEYFFIENPRGMMRKMDCLKDIPRYTVTYCQYGDTRMKPTDIWTNHPDPKFKPMCKNGDPCHVSAPRGSKTGTQGIKGAAERSRIPEQLCRHIAEICTENLPNNKKSEVIHHD